LKERDPIYEYSEGKVMLKELAPTKFEKTSPGRRLANRTATSIDHILDVTDSNNSFEHFSIMPPLRAVANNG
jgi:hypothetical protein